MCYVMRIPGEHGCTRMVHDLQLVFTESFHLSGYRSRCLFTGLHTGLLNIPDVCFPSQPIAVVNNAASQRVMLKAFDFVDRVVDRRIHLGPCPYKRINNTLSVLTHYQLLKLNEPLPRNVTSNFAAVLLVAPLILHFNHWGATYCSDQLLFAGT